MNLSYRELIKKSISITWRYKFLWIFGLFASIFNNIEIVKFLDQSNAGSQLILVWDLITKVFNFRNILELIKNAPLQLSIVTILSILFIGITIFFLWIAFRSQIAIIENVSSIEKGKAISFFEKFKGKKDVLKKVVTIIIGSKIIIILLGVIALLPQLATYWLDGRYTSLIAQIFIATILIGIFLISLFIYFVVIYAVNYVVLKKNTIQESIHNGIKLFTNHPGISIETILIILFISIVISKASVLLFKFFFIIIVVILNVTQSIFGYLIGGILIIAMLIFILALIGGVTVFEISLWTLLFERLTNKKHTGIFQSIVNRFIKK